MVKHVYVHAPQVIDGKRTQETDIVYDLVGILKTYAVSTKRFLTFQRCWMFLTLFRQSVVYFNFDTPSFIKYIHKRSLLISSKDTCNNFCSFNYFFTQYYPITSNYIPVKMLWRLMHFLLLFMLYQKAFFPSLLIVNFVFFIKYHNKY